MAGSFTKFILKRSSNYLNIYPLFNLTSALLQSESLRARRKSLSLIYPIPYPFTV